MATPNLTADRLRDALNYDPDSGVFSWRSPPKRGAVKSGQVAGTKVSAGYLQVKIDGRRYLCHRLAWFWCNGYWPDEVDHINGRPDDNRLCNIRDVTHAVNMQNKRAPMKNNSSGFLGVRYINNGWRASLGYKGGILYLGSFKSPEEAHQVYLAAKRRLHAGCTI